MSSRALYKGLGQAAAGIADDIGEKLKAERLAKYRQQEMATAQSNQMGLIAQNEANRAKAQEQQDALTVSESQKERDFQSAESDKKFEQEKELADHKQTIGSSGNIQQAEYVEGLGFVQQLRNGEVTLQELNTDQKNKVIKALESESARSAAAAGLKKGTVLDVQIDKEPELERDKAGAKTSGADTEKMRTARIQIGQDAAKGIPTVVRGLELLDLVQTGGPEALSLSIKQKLGAEDANEGELSNILSKSILSQLKETFGAQFTEKEGDRLTRIEANFGKNTETNKRLLNNVLQLAEDYVGQAVDDATARGDTDTVAALKRQSEFRLDPNFDYFKTGETILPTRSTSIQQQPQTGAPSVGQNVDGFTYMGGDPSLPGSWSKN